MFVVPVLLLCHLLKLDESFFQSDFLVKYPLRLLHELFCGGLQLTRGISDLRTENVLLAFFLLLLVSFPLLVFDLGQLQVVYVSLVRLARHDVGKLVHDSERNVVVTFESMLGRDHREKSLDVYSDLGVFDQNWGLAVLVLEDFVVLVVQALFEVLLKFLFF